MRQSALLREQPTRIAQFGDVCISELRAARHAATGRAAPLQDKTTLLFVLNGDICVGYGDLRLQLGPLDWYVCGTDPITLSASDSAFAVVMTMPGSSHTPCSDAIHSATTGMGNVLLSCIRSALKVGDELTSQARIELGNSLHDLARLAVRERTAPSMRLSGRSVMRERVKTFVRHHLRDSSLSIDDIAQTFNCTKRYLHKVFSEDERSLNQYIWDLRLDRCSQDLANRELLHCSITEIAFIWGFRSSPHFSRVFRQRFGASPSIYRASHLSGQPARVSVPRLPESRLLSGGLHPGRAQAA